MLSFVDVCGARASECVFAEFAVRAAAALISQSADDDARVELAHDRFVMNDVARATARLNVLQNGGVDPYSRMSLAVADLSGNDAIVTKKRRAGAGAGAAGGSMYGGYEDGEDADADDLDFDGVGGASSRYMSATEMSTLAAEEEAETEVYVAARVCAHKGVLCVIPASERAVCSSPSCARQSA
jgi:hypothetical protein